MDNNLVSVIIPSYNYARFIRETLDSLTAQTYQNWECFVVDDGSKDNTQQIVNEFVEQDKRIRYIYQNNAGQAAARNNALRTAKGKYVQFLDADDLLEPSKLERQVEFLEAHPEIDLVYGETRFFRNEFPAERRYSLREENLPWMPKISGSGIDIIEKLVEHNIFTVSSPLVRKTVIDAVGEFDARLNPVEDWDYWMRCAVAGVSMRYLEAENAMDLIRIHALSSTQNLRMGDYKRYLMRRKFARLLPDERTRRLNAAHLNHAEYGWISTETFEGVGQMKKGRLIEGAARICKAIMLNPATAGKILVLKLGKSKRI